MAGGNDTPWWRHASNHSGVTPGMPGMDDPYKVVHAIIWATVHNKREIPVGGETRLAYRLHHFMPHFIEKIAANTANKYQKKIATPAPASSGSLFKPMQSGTGVDDSVRVRIKEEKMQKKS